ncbi:hypothetical protein GIB67_038886 [Kingdonia uniflora]|uniref:Late embryogenesis abundant protein LEA-2 subgroup domain-containing protein n=1 Tax=Kingdonia uniflora TaxID=39325 RepID=A0A7J7M2L3_9MAGN|nr:hypothetical protein GIB67_038886 [Kingdonia uniflora]
MEERVPPLPPSGDVSESDDPPAPRSESDDPRALCSESDNSTALGSGTYLVQVPKDQIYRVPPPENALIAERYRKPVTEKSTCRRSLVWIFIAIVVIALIIGISLSVFYLTLNPKNPTFIIESVYVKKPKFHHQNPRYEIKFNSKNPNEGTAIIYQKGGSAILSFKKIEIASGSPPNFYQGNKGSKDFMLTLDGVTNVVLPHEVQIPLEVKRSMKGPSSKGSIALILSMNMPVRIKAGFGLLQTWTMNMDVSCSLRISTLAKGTKVTSQRCIAKI